MGKFHKAWEDFWFKFPLTRKWGSILYVRRHYGWTIREGVEMWRQAEKDQALGERDIFGEEQDVVGLFFSANAERQYEEASRYTCVYGCCAVLWFNGKYLGGWGPVGCPCENLDDPRDLSTEGKE